ADDEVAVRLGILQLAVGAEELRAGRPVELARAGVGGPVLDRGAEVVDGDAARPHRGRVDLDADGGLGAVDDHAAHAGKDADPLTLLGTAVIAELTRRVRVAGEGYVQDRLVAGVGLRVGWRRRGGDVRGGSRL